MCYQNQSYIDNNLSQQIQAMNNYPEWQQLKTYEGHIKRLKIINRKPAFVQKRHQNSRNRTATNITPSPKKYQTDGTPREKFTSFSEEKIKLMIKYKTEPAFKKTNVLRSPIPLVSQDEGNLIKDTLNSRSMSLKEKQLLLENYLLSRRILQTKSVIKPQQLKRQFRFHRKISANMSKSRSAIKYSQQRNQNFRKYEQQKKVPSMIEVGEGRNYLDIKFQQILLIKGIITQNPKVLYNLDLKIRTNKYQIHALSHKNLFQSTMRIRFKKSWLTADPDIIVFMSMVRENHEIQIGVFRPNLKAFDKDEKVVCKIVKGNFTVGTISIVGKVKYLTKTN